MIHPLGRRLLPVALRLGVSANAVSVTGLLIGLGAALAYSRFEFPVFALVGLLLSVLWLVADGLDGMIARATGTSSALGRLLDGVCDHGVFILIYVAMALRVGTTGGWALAITAGAAHAVQSSLYEGERARYHRRVKGIAEGGAAPGGGWLVRGYDRLAGLPGRLAQPFERKLASSADPGALAQVYGARAAAPMKLLSLETANVRVATIFLACLIGDPRLFWWFEIVPLTFVAVAGLVWHRRVERALLQFSSHNPTSSAEPARFFVKEQGQ